MGSTFYSIHYHIVFSTKERRPLIRPEWRARLHEYIGGTVRGMGGVAEAVGGVEDHIHLLVSSKTTDAPAATVREMKKVILAPLLGASRIAACSGGLASLDPRLLSRIPPGCQRNPKEARKNVQTPVLGRWPRLVWSAPLAPRRRTTGNGDRL
jgi:REP element-mobilizing transposase RayT